MSDLATQPADKVRQIVTQMFGEESGRVIGSLMRLTGDLDLAEECAQDAFMAALETWTVHGVPPNPGAWLTFVARNRAIDRLRRGVKERLKLEQLQAMTNEIDATTFSYDGDENLLRLIFICCHLALSTDTQIALTLRLVLGLSTAQIARALLTSEPTMAQRLTRAKSKIVIPSYPLKRLLAAKCQRVWQRFCTLSTSSSTRATAQPAAMNSCAQSYALRRSAWHVS